MKQGDFFEERLFPVRQRSAAGPRATDLSLRIKTAMGEALKCCPDSATVIAARMSELTGRVITADALYAFTAPSKPDHDISITRFVAFIRATQQFWLWDELLADDGLVVLEGEEAQLAELGALQQEQQRINAAVKGLQRTLRQAPVAVRRRQRP